MGTVQRPSLVAKNRKILRLQRKKSLVGLTPESLFQNCIRGVLLLNYEYQSFVIDVLKYSIQVSNSTMLSCFLRRKQTITRLKSHLLTFSLFSQVFLLNEANKTEQKEIDS